MHSKWIYFFVALVISSLLTLPAHMVIAQGTRPYLSVDQLSEQTLSSVQPVTSLLSSGPDHFGYIWDDSVPFTWLDTSAGTDTGFAGDAAGQATGLISLPFPFKYYENTYDHLYIAAPGYLAFAQAFEWKGLDSIPAPSEPNNIIAPYWSPTTIGPGSWVHYDTGGSAPERYFVVEWHAVTGAAPFTGSYIFEVILHENGDIVFQYLSMSYSSGIWVGASGIENADGLDGLSYLASGEHASYNKAVRFIRPTPSDRLLLYPPVQSGLTTTAFQFSILNIGETGTDTFDLSAVSALPFKFYAADGNSLLSDSDGDMIVDTGPLARGEAANIIVRFSPEEVAKPGDDESFELIASSSLEPVKSKTAHLFLYVPADFINVFVDASDGAMSLVSLNTQAGISIEKVTGGNYSGHDMAVITLPDRKYLYTWSRNYYRAGALMQDIEYVLLDQNGNIQRSITKLVDNSGAALRTDDDSPSVTVAPDGTLGLAWRRWSYNSSTAQFNYNVYFATLDASGNLLSGPTNVTGNTIWSTGADFNIPAFNYPGVVATSDNHFLVIWEDYRTLSPGSESWNIWSAVLDTNGTSVSKPAALTSDNQSSWPILNSLAGDKAIMTWKTLNGEENVYYAILDSAGAMSGDAMFLGSGNSPADAVLLPNGKAALAWLTATGVQLSILDSSYQLEYGPVSADSPTLVTGMYLSMTSDAFSNVIMTWLNADTNKELFYALADSAANFITPPVPYKGSANPFEVSIKGLGTAIGFAGLAPMSVDTVGVFNPQNGGLYLKTINTSGFADLTLTYGLPGDIPLAGDWNGDGIDTVGVYRAGSFYLRNSNSDGFADLVFAFGVPGDQPVVGDWDGDGLDTIGVYRSSLGHFFLRNSNSSGPADLQFSLGIAGDMGISGDWDGDGFASAGVFRPTNGGFYLKNANTSGVADVKLLGFGLPGDYPVVGNWDGDAAATDTIGVYRGDSFYLRNSNSNGLADVILTMGLFGNIPIAGDWNGIP
jgi:hypothetical protein